MANMVIMPKLGATMDVGKIIRWFINEGDSIAKGAPLLEVESDKATLEVESPFDGTLLKILHPDGDIPVLQPIGIIGTPGEDISGLIGSDDTAKIPASPAEEKVTEPLQAEKSAMEPEKHGIRSTPAAKYAAKINNVDLAQIAPNESGIITGKEVEEYLKTAAISATPLEAPVTLEVPVAGMDAQNAPRTRKMGNIRRKTAEKMTSTWQTVPMAANAIEVDASRALALCDAINRKSSDGSFKINLTDILIKVLASAVAGYPEINAYIDGDTIVYRDDVNVGFAVALEDGLVVPVIRNADRKGLMQINAEKRELASRARAGKISIDEMSGGSITLTNMGSFGEGIFLPIINAPELCIVGTGKVVEKPVVINGEIVIRPMMWVALTFDHRALDGVPAAKVLKRIKDLIETPELFMC